MAACVYAVFKIRPLLKERANFLLGRMGEVYVGQNLELLREKGFKVLHDVPGEGFNVDHILIGPKGIFTIETKMRRKAAKASTTIAYNGKTISMGGIRMDPDPLRQAKGQARWLKDLLKKQTQKDFAVRPVVLFPGWYVESAPHGADAWVLNPKALPAFIDHQQDTMTSADIESVYARLADYVRTSNSGTP